MKFDMHFHVVGRGNDIDQVDDQVFFYPEDNNMLLTSVLYRLVEKYLGEEGADFDHSGTIDTDEYLTLIYKHLSTYKEIDGVVLLALDALYGPRSGKLDRRKTDLWVSNRFLAKKVKELNDQLMREGLSGKKFYWGASVSPSKRLGRGVGFCPQRSECGSHEAGSRRCSTSIFGTPDTKTIMNHWPGTRCLCSATWVPSTPSRRASGKKSETTSDSWTNLSNTA